MMLMGFALVRLGVVEAQQSKSLSMVSLYLVMPCAVLNAFQVENSPQTRAGLLLALAGSLAVQGAMIAVVALLKKPLKLTPVERASVVYSNAGNLVIPITAAVLGQQWVVYASAYISLQMLLLWSHCRGILCQGYKANWRQVLGNINMVAIFVGLAMFITGIQFPPVVADAVSSVADTIGPLSMIVTGMLIGGMPLRRLFNCPRAYGIVALRMLAMPLLALGLLKFTGLGGLVPGGATVLLVTLLSSITPPAAAVTQLAQVYGQDAEYASVLNLLATLACLATMPLMVVLYQL